MTRDDACSRHLKQRRINDRPFFVDDVCRGGILLSILLLDEYTGTGRRSFPIFRVIVLIEKLEKDL